MKWVRRSAVVMAFLLAVLAGAAWWVLGTRSGMQFALARAVALTNGALQVGGAQGRLAGPLDLTDIHYDDGKGTRIGIDHLHLELRAWPLLSRRAHVRDLQLEGVAVSLPENPPPRENPVRFSLQPSVPVWVDHAQARAVRVTRGKAVLFAADRINLRGNWTHDGLDLKQLEVHAPQGFINVNGTLAQDAGYHTDTRASFAWRIGTAWYAGALVAHSDGAHARLAFNLSRPMVAALRVDMAQGGDNAWRATLDAPSFDPQPLLGASALDRLGLALHGTGNREHAALTGRIDLNDYALRLQPLRARLDHNLRHVTIEQLALASPQIEGRLAANGLLDFSGDTPSARLAVRWNDVQLPAALVGQTLDSHGQLALDGSIKRYHAQGDIVLGPPDKPVALTLNLDGDTKRIALHTLALKQKQGGLEASGTLTLQPVLAWQAQARAKHFNPGPLFADWDGALDFAMASHGSLPANGPDANLALHQLGGRLRGHAVSGSGKLHLSPDRVLDGKLRLASGSSTVTLDARPGADNDVNLTFAIAALGDWLPQSGGRLDGHFAIRGTTPRLSINGQLRGQALARQQQRADTLHLIVGIPDLGRPAGKLDLAAGNVKLQGLSFQRIHLLAEGSPGNHEVRLDARGTQLSTTLAMHGALKGSAWRGNLNTVDLAPQGMPAWRLREPARLTYNDGAMSLSELCLDAGDPLLCVTARRDAPGNLDASYRLQALPLALLLNASGNADLPMRADGMLEGSGTFRRSTGGVFSGNATIGSAHGAITYTDRPEAPLLVYDQFRLDADLGPSGQHIVAHAGLDNNGRLDGQMHITGARRALAGQLSLRLNDLGLVELFSSALANVKGRLAGNFQFAGTLAQPELIGTARIAHFAAEVPAAGLKLDQGMLAINSADARQFHLDGSVQSGQGRLAINGHASIGGDANTTITLKGSHVTAADIPAARVVVSPDLIVKHDANGIDIGGVVTLDSANVDMEKLPGAAAAQRSPDVVVVDQAQREQAASKLPVRAHVKVDLGGKTHVVGMGLDGRLSGVLTVDERPGRATSGQGQIAVDGTYRAYGQNLHIERGMLLFASTPVDNPGLNIRAVRKLNPNATIDHGQEVGLLVSGTAQRPILTVFSNPVMEQSDALSYLVTGKPLSQVKGGEGDMVNAAAQALGSAAGDLLAKSVGSKLGVDDIGVSSNEALGGGSAFTVGKYLSPRLYLSYGVGLFEPGEVITLRYRLSHRWNFEAQNATDFSRASFNYRIEK